MAEAQVAAPHVQPCHKLCQNLRTVLENPDLPDLLTPTAPGKRYRDRRLVYVQPDIGDSAHQARLQYMRLCAGHPAQPPPLRMLRDGPTDRFGRHRC
jgi:hypothetical protein